TILTKTSRLIVAAILLFNGQLALAIPMANHPMQQAITALLKQAQPDFNLGMIVLDAKTGTSLYQHQADHYFMPASSQKLFTAYAAYRYLKPDFVYQTYLFADLMKVQ